MSWFRCCCGATETDFDSVTRQSLDSVSHPSKDEISSGKIQEVSGTVTIDVEKEVSKPALVSDVAALVTGPVTIDVSEKEISKPVLVSEVPSVAWVIGLDFGTTNSGFAFAQATDNPHIYCHYDWKGAEKPCCKTLTRLFYTRNASTGQLTCTSWGHPARSDYIQLQPQQRGEHLYLETLKLLVKEDFNDPKLLRRMPPSLTPADLVSTYLKLIGDYALSEVERHHNKNTADLFHKDAVQWYVTVPSIWDENAKQQMKDCMVLAGLITADRVNRIQIVLEPEAGSFYCHQVLREGRKDVSLNTNDKIMVADVGGGTVDIVVQEMMGSSQTYKVKELTESSGGLCGGKYVDERFRRFLAKKIPCLEEFLSQRPRILPLLLRSWEDMKSAFGHEEMSSWADTKDIDLPRELAERWEASCKNSEDGQGGDYSVVALTEQDLKAIFDPVVDEILELIGDQLQRFPDIKVIFVVGGFAGSPYLIQRIRACFENQVKHIVSPPNPGSAIVYGAVLLALHPDAIVSRVSRKRL